MSDLELSVLSLAKEYGLSRPPGHSESMILIGTHAALAWFQDALLRLYEIETSIIITRRSGKVVDGPRIEIHSKVFG